ncbi:MAG: SMP-30/gluconolactonase/LRE family protein [Candidatus Limnocylindria bacterium]
MSPDVEGSLTDMNVLMTGIAFGESPRWRDGRPWFSDWGAGRVLSLDADGTPTIEAEVHSFPMCIDFLPDGRLLVVSSADRQVLRRETDGSLVAHAELAGVSEKPWNDIVVDGRGSAYVNSIGFDFPGEEFAPGIVVLVKPDGSVTPVADGLAFPNGMAVTADNATLIVAESYAEQLTAYDIADDGTLTDRRVWAATPGDHPDGICLDADGAVWFADVGNRHCVRVREGGEVLMTVELDRGAFACALSRDAEPTLCVVGQDWGGPDAVGGATGQVVSFPAPAPGAGYP